MDKADDIAKVVLDEFDQLPANRKPAVRSNGIREWVPLSGIVAELEDGELVCVALATGMKCLPVSKLSRSKGVGIHDWHAEVLAIRAFNRFVLQECRDVLLHGNESPFVQFRSTDGATTKSNEKNTEDTDSPWGGQPFEWVNGVSLHMYCSEAPCGDASMELTMAAQDDASPWDTVTAPAEEEPGSTALLSGRGYFSRLGTVRRKPGRADAPPTLSKSCSDKLALRQCTTLLSGLASLLIAPGTGLCLRSIVLPVSQYSETGCRRSFSAGTDIGRLTPVKDRTWAGGYAFVPFTVQTTNLEFAYSKRSPLMASSKHASSNISVVWTLNGINECLVNGVLRGRKAFDPIGASAVSRRQMWKLAQQVAMRLPGNTGGRGETIEANSLQKLFNEPTYDAVKGSSFLVSREAVKEDVKTVALRGWTKNESDGDWGLDTI